MKTKKQLTLFQGLALAWLVFIVIVCFSVFVLKKGYNKPYAAEVALSYCDPKGNALDAGATFPLKFARPCVQSNALANTTPQSLSTPVQNNPGWVKTIAPGVMYMYDVLIHRTTPSLMFAAGYLGLAKSTDTGVNWQAIQLDYPNQFYSFAQDPSNTSVMYVGGNYVPSQSINVGCIKHLTAAVPGQMFSHLTHQAILV